MDFAKLFSLEGKVALITGGSRGIGKMLLEGYLAAGCARVYITARKREQLAETEAEFNAAYPGKVIGLPGDLSQMDEIKRLVAELEARETRLDILVNNAGAAWGGEFEEFPEAGWDKVMDLNVKSLFFLTQKLFPLLKAAGSFDRPAKVINIASIDGLRPNPWETWSYHASKAAVIHLTRRMAARLIKDNIVVSCIAPGAYPSEMNKAAAKNPEGAWALPRTSPAARSTSPAVPATMSSAPPSRSTAGSSTAGSQRASRIPREGTELCPVRFAP
jgi:NAD(P)-dependent dehydrogenase (short-subunit alcohol dehydrogenase family)